MAYMYQQQPDHDPRYVDMRNAVFNNVQGNQMNYFRDGQAIQLGRSGSSTPVPGDFSQTVGRSQAEMMAAWGLIGNNGAMSPQETRRLSPYDTTTSSDTGDTWNSDWPAPQAPPSINHWQGSMPFTSPGTAMPGAGFTSSAAIPQPSQTNLPNPDPEGPYIEWPEVFVKIPDLSSQVTCNIDIESPMAAGGYGEIYHGEWTPKKDETTHKVVVKILKDKDFRKAKDKDRMRKRLGREVRTWSALNSHYIVKLLGIAYISDKPAMVMPYYANGDASHYLKDASIERRMEVVRDLCRALVFLHNRPRPVVHGDVKGKNVLIDEDGHAALTDFGLSRIMDEVEVSTGLTTTATPSTDHWAAPEIHEADAETWHTCFTTTSDVWAFACTAYELLTGKIPYYTETRRNGVPYALKDGKRPQWEENGVPLCRASKHLRTLLEKCWAQEPSERPFIKDIDEELDSLRY